MKGLQTVKKDVEVTLALKQQGDTFHGKNCLQDETYVRSENHCHDHDDAMKKRCSQ